MRELSKLVFKNTEDSKKIAIKSFPNKSSIYFHKPFPLRSTLFPEIICRVFT
jgi:hypothetical protein